MELLSGTTNIFKAVAKIIGALIPIVFALALLYFFWGVGRYILSVGTDKEQGRQIMIWGVVALFVMSAIWGITTLLGRQLGITPDDIRTAPQIPSIDTIH